LLLAAAEVVDKEATVLQADKLETMAVRVGMALLVELVASLVDLVAVSVVVVMGKAGMVARHLAAAEQLLGQLCVAIQPGPVVLLLDKTVKAVVPMV
jgi:hypothetical protein